MKKLLLILLLFFACFNANIFSQGIINQPIIAKQKEYARPQEWFKIDQYVSTTDEKIVLLYAVFESTANYVSFRTITGAYNVSIYHTSIDVANLISSTDKATGTAFETNLLYSNSPEAEISRGYKQQIIVITPQAGSHLATAYLTYTHTSTANMWVNKILDCVCAGTYFTKLTFSEGATYPTAGTCTMLEHFKFKGTCNISDASYMFYGTTSMCLYEGIEDAPITTYNNFLYGSGIRFNATQNRTTATDDSYKFYGCSRLQFPNDTGTNAVTTWYYKYRACSNLKMIPNDYTKKVTTMYRAFYSCTSLLKIGNTDGGLDVRLCTNFSGLLTGVTTVTEVNLTNIRSDLDLTNQQLDSLEIVHVAMNCCEILTTNVAPATDWEEGDIITGQTSGTTCTLVCKLSATTWLVKSRGGVAYTDGEIIGVTGVANKLADQNDGAPAFNGYTLTVTGNKGSATFTAGAKSALAALIGWTIVW